MTFKQTKSERHLRNTLRRLSTPIITILFAMLLTVVTWGQTLEKGIYSITNSVSHDNPVGQGMARSYTEEISDVEVNDSGIFVTLGFNNTQYMGDFTISVGGSKVTYETTIHANNIKKLKFKVPSLSSSIKVGLHVIPMNTTVEYTVTLNEGSLKLIEKAEAEEEPTQNSTGNNTNNGNNSTANNTTNSNTSSNTTNNNVSSTTDNKGNGANSNIIAGTSSPSKQEQNQGTSQSTNTSPEEAKKPEATGTTQKGEMVAQKEEVVNGTDAQSQEMVEGNLEKEDQDVVTAEDQSEAQDKGQEEQSEQAETEAETIEDAETIDAITSASQHFMKNMMVIIGVIVVAVIGVIGVVIYLKRK